MVDDNAGRATHIASLVRAAIPPMHPGGRPIVGAVALGTLGLRYLLRKVGLRKAGSWATRFGLVATAGSAAFFRAPVRVSPQGDGVVVAAGDGVVSLIEDATPPPELGLGPAPRLRVSVFLSVLDVHVQRIPMNGVITRIAYHPGKFLSADLAKASEDNERNSLVIRDSALGTEVVVVQIAGLLARRIVCDAIAGATANLGDTYGLIRFGSRIDTYLPAGTDLEVLVGQRTIGGETVLAVLAPKK